jgi:hypothetical protein
MTDPAATRSEKYLRFTHRGMVVTLLLVLAVGGVCVAMAIRPQDPRWSAAMLPLWIIAIVVTVGLQRTLGGDRWDARAPEARAIMDDEWRRSNMDRARRIAFGVVLGAQLPLAWLLSRLPASQAALAMAAATVTAGLATFIALFLYYDRDAADAA